MTDDEKVAIYERDRDQIASLVLSGAYDEPLCISSDLQTSINNFSDTEWRFELRSHDGSKRYGLVITMTKLRNED